MVEKTCHVTERQPVRHRLVFNHTQICFNGRPHPGQAQTLIWPSATLSHPMGEGQEGELFAVFLKNTAIGLAGQSFAKRKT